MVKEKTDSEKLAEELSRTFEFTVDGEDREFTLQMPTSVQIRQAEWHYAKVYNKALVEGVTTTPEMMDILTSRGLYGPDYEAKLQELQVGITLKVSEMHNADVLLKEELALEVRVLREQLYRWNQRLTGPLSNTCEQMAEDAKTEYLTSAVICDSKGNNLWDTYDAFISEENQAFAMKARFEVLLWLQGLDADFLQKTPENKVLNELSGKKKDEEEEEESTNLLVEKPKEAPAKKKQKKTTKLKKNSK